MPPLIERSLIQINADVPATIRVGYSWTTVGDVVTLGGVQR
jgi:hypothetical protein